MNYWMNLPEEYRKGKFVILPVSYEKDVTFGTGAALGPSEIIKASEHLEYYDEQFDCEPFEKGIELLPEVKAETPEEMISKIPEIKDKFVIGLGGDHSVTIGLTKNLSEDTSVIILDAHADLFHSWNGSTLNHRCVVQRLSAKHEVLMLGVRSMDISEKEIIDQNEKVRMIKSYDFNLTKLKEVLPKLKDKVYISIDVDVFDPSFIRNTGTPEPGGFSWNQVITILKVIFSEKKVVGADVVEFAPKENFQSEAYSLAKLCYKIMSLSSKDKQTL
jgi:agmatinase